MTTALATQPTVTPSTMPDVARDALGHTACREHPAALTIAVTLYSPTTFTAVVRRCSACNASICGRCGAARPSWHVSVHCGGCARIVAREEREARRALPPQQHVAYCHDRKHHRDEPCITFVGSGDQGRVGVYVLGVAGQTPTIITDAPKQLDPALRPGLDWLLDTASRVAAAW